MAKLTEYTTATRFDAGDILIKDGTNGTKKITAANAAAEFAGLVSAVQHRNVYRGKNLGTSITEAQKTAISSGTFDDLFIGDYWTLNDTKYTIADMNYWYGTGDGENQFNRNHLVMIPDGVLYAEKMNESNTTEGGYVGSHMYTDGLTQAKTKVSTDFGDMLLTHREYLANAVTNGHPSGVTWVDSTVELMNEIMVYGCSVHSPSSDGSETYNKTTIDNIQLALFRLYPRAVHCRKAFWLRDIVSPAAFAGVHYIGAASYFKAAIERNNGGVDVNVRPVFAIG